MGKITRKTFPEKDFTLFQVRETVLADEVIEAGMAFLQGNPTLLVLWDFTDADMRQFTSEAVQKTALLASKFGHSRKGGKTAIVFPSDLGYGIGRMYETYAELKNVPFETRVFHSIGEAEQWLGILE